MAPAAAEGSEERGGDSSSNSSSGSSSSSSSSSSSRSSSSSSRGGTKAGKLQMLLELGDSFLRLICSGSYNPKRDAAEQLRELLLLLQCPRA
ncbi:hypothetical protein ENH_00058240 [Eimeria necatrix]|uniref:Uncharacterized protein n=1 Tax=Eimeria necatrix TaxID=51315 RepID=U6N4C0_9EIME|nr:hypothetical protein ENH_00058240 [Eimeria necatrix]CDJ68790.1 hypothetical protein ENH_00058240 [Eimeria necatrix]